MGSGNVGLNVLREFTAATSEEIVALVPESWPEEQLQPIRERATLLQAEAGTLNKLVGENLTLRNVIRRHKINALFSLTDTSMVRCPIPHLLLVQQLFLAYGPDEWDFPVPGPLRRRIWIMDRYFKAGLPTITMLTVQTHAMRRRLASRWNLPLDCIRVIPSALPAKVPAPEWNPDRTDSPYVVYPSHGEPYKNHIVLAAMLAVLASHGADVRCRLTTTPEDVPEFHEECGRRGVLTMVEFLGPVPQGRVWELLSNAIALVNPSKMESFGLTYYEAMAAGCPVIAADRDFTHEACGEAALYCEADSGSAFAQAVMTVLGSPAEGERLSRLGRDRFRTAARKWPSVVEEYRSLLHEMTGEPRGWH